MMIDSALLEENENKSSIYDVNIKRVWTSICDSVIYYSLWYFINRQKLFVMWTSTMKNCAIFSDGKVK